MSFAEDRGIAPPKRPPAFNVPTIVLVSIAAFAMAHALRTMILGPLDATWILLNFAFIPGCYTIVDEVCALREPGALLWSPFSHAFLHGDWMHFGANALWLLAFGTPVARRIGNGRFLLFCAVGAAAGALAFLVMNPDLIEPVVGASGVVSALMGGACRFAFSGPQGRPFSANGAWRPLTSVGAALADRTVLFFILVFFATNLIVGTGLGAAFAGGPIAWEAHLGGFVFGFLGFQLFDRRRP
ncbi:rhomboid family intramembrane serine protease [Aurantimonas sp. Leaf443]|uniref:rhomboid family intramembrane serine protease n=1 Tax=Aurantimonas sp. Leaf443 TaxID=1736378 RepID=UPI0006FE748F|nr:rhomboid family intramembrane serine protease [Aurantimonas sp. Leaf443]KQT86302.1 protease [Aurantimonas sp. Leaf443]